MTRNGATPGRDTRGPAGRLSDHVQRTAYDEPSASQRDAAKRVPWGPVETWQYGSDRRKIREREAQPGLSRRRAAWQHREAARQLAREDAEQLGRTPAPPRSLVELLAQPRRGAAYRVDGLLPIGGRVVITAPAKTGKTTLVAELVRSLVDGAPFLGRFVTGAVGRVVLVDTEMSERQLVEWYGRRQLAQPERVTVWTVRGSAATFDPCDDVLGIAENDNTEVGRYLAALDALAREAGIGEVVVIHHTGHEGTRARGASVLLGWPDALWEYTRGTVPDGQSDEPADGDDLLSTIQEHAVAPRYLRAYGRDVDLPRSRVTYDPGSGALTLGADVRTERATAKRDAEAAASAKLRAEVLALLVEHGPLITRDVAERTLGSAKGRSSQRVRAALDELEAASEIESEPGGGRTVLYRAAAGVSVHKGPGVSQGSPDTRESEGVRVSECPPIGDTDTGHSLGAGSGGAEGSQSSASVPDTHPAPMLDAAAGLPSAYGAVFGGTRAARRLDGVPVAPTVEWRTLDGFPADGAA